MIQRMFMAPNKQMNLIFFVSKAWYPCHSLDGSYN